MIWCALTRKQGKNGVRGIFRRMQKLLKVIFLKKGGETGITETSLKCKIKRMFIKADIALLKSSYFLFRNIKYNTMYQKYYYSQCVLTTSNHKPIKAFNLILNDYTRREQQPNNGETKSISCVSQSKSISSPL